MARPVEPDADAQHVLLLVSLLAVVLLAKKFSLVVDVGTAMIGRRRHSLACWSRF